MAALLHQLPSNSPAIPPFQQPHLMMPSPQLTCLPAARTFPLSFHSLSSILLTYLAGYYAGVTATPSIIRGHLLEPELMASNLAAPFAARRADGGAVFGVPTKLDPDIVCDNRSELLRMAAAAIISFMVYMNFKQVRPGGGEEGRAGGKAGCSAEQQPSSLARVHSLQGRGASCLDRVTNRRGL